jgi:ABC-2 type transport system permease protein
MKAIRFIAQKEMYHILRDPRSLLIVIAMPILMTFMYGYAIDLDVDRIVLAVIDADQSRMSRELIDQFAANTYFNLSEQQPSLSDPEHLLKSADADAVLFIRPGFETEVSAGRTFPLGLLVDGADNNVAAAVVNYSQSVVVEFTSSLRPQMESLPVVELAPRVLYNPNLESAIFFVPGLVAIIMMMISALLTSITIAREKETGTIEQLLVAPVTPMQILVGKILPYIFVALLDGILVLVLAWILFDLPFVGSQLLLLGFGLIYVGTALSLGTLISTLVRTQQVAMMLAVLVTMLPSVMLSGFIFPIKNMPVILQALAHIQPAKYFITIIRGILLKGAGLEVLAVHAAAMVGLMIVMILVATKRFTTRLG